MCIDEKPKQLTSEVREGLPAKPARVERFDYEYVRGGVANMFVAFEPLAGFRDIKVTERRTKRDFAAYMKELSDIHYSEAERIILVMDNLNTHTTAALYEVFEPAEAKTLRFTTHRSMEVGLT